MIGPTQLLHNALTYAGISARFLRQSQILRELRPRAVATLLGQVARGLRGPMALLRLHALGIPEQPAVVVPEEGLRLSYRELDARILRLAHNLRGLGVQPGDRFALLCENGHEFIELVAALGYLSATAVQIGYRLKPPEIGYILSNSGARGLLFHAAYEQRVREALSGLKAPPSVLVVAGAGAGPSRAGYRPYEELTSTGHADEPPYVRDGGYGSFMLYTSGTTGKSKGARRDLKATSFTNVLALLSELPLRHDDRHLVTCPLYHAAASAFSGFVAGVGGCLVVPRHVDAERIAELIPRERITSSVMVPTQLQRLCDVLESAPPGRYDLSSLRWIMSAAAPLPTALAARVEALLGPILFNLYGATETGLVTLARPGEHTARPGTIGRALFGNDIRLLDEQGREVGVGQVGELYVKNGTLVSGYYGDDAATRSAQRDGYFTVGDLGYRDADGYYYLADRKSDLVISGGVNIYPLEIEQRLHAHPQVKDCAVIGVPDAEWGESLCAFIVPREPPPDAEAFAAELRRFVAEALADFKRPRRVVLIAEIPRNPTGKIDKRALRQLAAG
jgi:fatty-acyl-CoA synthase